MRVALVGPVYPYRGGIAHYTTLLAHHLRAHSLFVISFRRQYPAWLFPGRSDRDDSEQPLRVDDALYEIDPLNPLSWWRTAKKLRDIKPDILLMQWWVTFWAPCFASILRLYRRWMPDSPVVAFCHNVLPHEPHWWDHFLARSVLSLATHHVVHSAQERARLLALLPDARVTAIPFPTYGQLVTRRCGREEARRRLGLSPDLCVLLFFGFVRPYKGLAYLLRAMGKIRDQVPAHLLIVGEFWESKERYVRLMRELGVERCVTIVDRYVANEDLGLYLGAADVMVLPYVGTSQSAAARVALDAGLPVIASRVGGLSEMISDGVDGLLVQPCDPDSLADAIFRFFRQGLNTGSGTVAEIQHGGDGWMEVVQAVERLAGAAAVQTGG